MNEILKEISLTLTRPRGSLIGFASLVYRDEWFFSDIGVHLTKAGDGIRLAFPDKTLFSGKRMNIFFPISREVGEAVRIAIANKYFELMKDCNRRDESMMKEYYDNYPIPISGIHS